MMKTLLWIIFGLAALAQWFVPLSAIRLHEQTLTKGTLFKIKCAAPDPYDPLRGRYLAVRPQQQQVDVPADTKLGYRQQVFGTLTIGPDGLATITHLSPTPPASGDFIRLKTTYASGEKIGIEWPFDRFYINEKLAPEADKWFAENIRSRDTAEGILAEVRVLDGRAVLADLSLHGKPFREILKERLK
jgi:uncharacterized membrane-anchored protein